MGSNLGVDGLISGLRASDIIQQMMAVERRPLQALDRNKASAEKRLTALRDLNTRLSALQSAVAALTLRSTAGAKSATVSAPTALRATAGPEAANGTYQVTIHRLATATSMSSAGPIGQAIDASAVLASAGFATTPTTGTFSINGVQITLDAATILSDGTDAAGANTVFAKINSAGAGVTASLVNDSGGRPNVLRLVGAPGQSIQLGAGADTSNFLSAATLDGATVVGHTAATVTGAPVAAGALAGTSITINGVTTVTTATGAGNTAAQNAASIAADINNTAGSTVTAVGNADGTLTLTQKTLGASQKVDITGAGTGTGLSAGTTQNGRDRIDSVLPLGTVQTGQALTAARLAVGLTGLNADGTGSFKINGVEISFRDSESLNTVISRINAAGAGVTATYDPVRDRITLKASELGGQAISLEDVTGNFLAATGVLGATQSYGQNASLTISGVNNNQPISVAGNQVKGYLPGVTLDLLAAGSDPVTVTVGQNTLAIQTALQTFVDKFNAVTDFITSSTAGDPATRVRGPLAGDSLALGIGARLRTLISEAAVGATGKYQTLADIGISTGPIGSAVGTTKQLKLDAAKLSAALADNPQAVEAVLQRFESTTTLAAGGTGSIASVSGTPYDRFVDGTYQVTDDGAGNLTAVFTPTGGLAQPAVTGTIPAGGTNTSLISGLTLTARAGLQAGTDTLSLSVQTKGIAVSLNSYLKGLQADGGALDQRIEAADDGLTTLSRQRAALETRLAQREERLLRQFTALESVLATLQGQGNQLSAQLAQLAAP